MPTATAKPVSNPLLDRIRADGIFNGGMQPGQSSFAPGAFAPGQVQPGPDIGQTNTMANGRVYMPGTFGASNAVANGTGSVFGGGMDGQSAPAAPMTPFGGGMTGGSPAAPTGAFSGGLPPPGMVGVNPVHAYAPTGLDQRAMATPGQGVWGQGDVMASFDGKNAQGGNAFSLGQVSPVGGPLGGPVAPQNPIGPETLQPAGYRPANPGGIKPSPNAGLLAAFDADSPTGKYIRAQEAAKMPVDMEHLKLLTTVEQKQNAHDLNERKFGLSEKTTDAKLSAADQKAADAAQGHAATLSQINEQNKAVMTNIDKAIDLAPQAGAVAGRMVGTVLAPEGVKQLHGLIDSIAGNEMMDYIQRLKAANPQGTIGFRVLDTEAKAMSNVFAAIKNDKVPLEQQSPAFVKEQLTNLKGHLARMNAIANGQDPDAVAPMPSPATAQNAGDLSAQARAILASRKKK